MVRYSVATIRDRISFASGFQPLEMARSRSEISAQEVYSVRAGVVFLPLLRLGRRMGTADKADNADTGKLLSTTNVCRRFGEQRTMDTMDWSVDVAPGTGNGRVRMPGIRAMKALQNLSQAQ